MAEQELTDAQQQEIDSASENALRQEPARDVRQWLQDVHSATLSTLSLSAGVEGFPACSVVPFALDRDGAPFILIAEIAAHTRNLLRDNRCSLFIRSEAQDGDPQAHWRATLMGRMERLVVESEQTSSTLRDDDALISASEFEALKARYRERVPKSDGYFGTHSFGFWRMRSVRKVRYIAGFGRICWFHGAHVLAGTPDDLQSMSSGAIEHMNVDHVDAMEVICRKLHGVEPDSIQMTALDSRGFFMRHRGTPSLLYTSFGKEIDGAGLRQAMVEITKRARASES